MSFILLSPLLFMEQSNALLRFVTVTHDLIANTSSSNFSDFVPQSYSNLSTEIDKLSPPEESKAYWALLLLIIPFLTVFGNSLVILSVGKNASLKTSINLLIAGLALADLMVALAVMPFAVYVLYNNNNWYLGGIVCDVYCSMDVMCSTASIVLLAVISFDRYMAVSRPMYYSRTSHSLNRAGWSLVAVWAISAAVASPMALGLNAAGRAAAGHTDECRFYNADFILYSSIISFAIPLVILVVLYANIFYVIRRRHRLAIQRKIQQSVRKISSTATAGQAIEATKLVVIKNHFRSRSDTNTSDEDFDLDESRSAQNNHPNSLSIQYRAASLGSTCESEGTPMRITTPTVIVSMESTPVNSERHQLLVRRATTALANAKNYGGITASTKTSVSTNPMPSVAQLKNGSDNRTFQPSPQRSRSLSNTGKLSKSERNIAETIASESSVDSKLVSGSVSTSIIRKKSSFAKFQSAVDTLLHPKRLSACGKMTDDHSRESEHPDTSIIKAARLKKRMMAKERKKQRKATKTLAVVIGVFLACWLPFFTLNFRDAICLKLQTESCQVGLLPFIVTTWIGYMNSFMNPIIYTIFNHEFRAAFIKLLSRRKSRDGTRL